MAVSIAPLCPHLCIAQPALVKRYRRVNQLRSRNRPCIGGLPVKAQGLIGDGRYATESNLGAGQMARGFGIDRGKLREIDEVGDRREWIIDLVRDGTGKPSHGV